MRFVLTTRYAQDINLFRHNGQRFWYGLLAVLVVAGPWLTTDFYVGELALVFIWAIAGIGLMLLVGYTGLVSLGHAAFLAIGAYTHAVLLGYGVPFPISVLAATLLAAGVGALVGIPALRMTGVYLAVATLAFERIVAYAIEHWQPVTGGLRGMRVPQPELFGVSLIDPHLFYYVCLAVLVVGLFAALNLLRSPTGRAFVAVRDSEISAESMGVNLARTKAMSFAVSAAFTGLAGALYAHKIGHLSPEAFTVQTSIQLLLLVVVGGLGSLHGVILRGVVRRLSTASDRLGARCPPGGRRPDSRTGAGRVRRHLGARAYFRAAGCVRPLVEDSRLVRRVPFVSQGHAQAAEVLLAHRARALARKGAHRWHCSKPRTCRLASAA